MSAEEGTNYWRPWLWMKGNQVSQIGDSLNIKIGGDSIDKKPKHVQTNKIKSTKYTLITFLPQNLLEQFRRIANFYFLCMTVISSMIDSPVSPLTSLLPLSFVIFVTAAKQGYEDYLRHRADNMVNYSLVTVIRNGDQHDIKCQDIRQGDLVKLARDCDMPCDLVVLKTSDPDGFCHVTTANLDGETNLKTLNVPKGLPNLSVEQLHTLGQIECEHPRVDLYTFNGKIELVSSLERNRLTFSIPPTVDSNTVPLMAENLLLRGSRLKNTEWVIGCAVYTGQSTKLALNSKITSNKTSSSESFINKYLVFFLFLLIVAVTVSYFMKRYYDYHYKGVLDYLGAEKRALKVSQFLQDYFSFLILFNYLIPISLYVTIEMHKFLGGFFLEWDHELYDEETDQPCIVNTSDLNEDLGQVQLLFSDKTGTLTKNIMIFQQCSINGKRYVQNGSRLQEDGRSYGLKINQCSNHVFNFFEALSLCHTVQVAGDYTNDKDGKSNESDDDDGQHEYIISQTENNPPTTPNFDEINEEASSINTLDNDSVDFSKMTAELTPPLFQPNHEFLNPLLKEKPLYRGDTRSIDSTNLLIQNYHNVLKLGNDVLPSNKVFPLEISMNPEGIELRKDNENLQKMLFSSKNSSNDSVNKFTASLDLKRTLSHYEEKEKMDAMTHRRVKSYVPANTYQIESSVILRNPSPLTRSPVSRRSTTREYYAAPAYTEASLLERQDSSMRAKEVMTFIDKLDYQASSPDEKALVEVCAKMGLVYIGNNGDTLNIRLKNSYVKKRRDEYSSKEEEELVQYERLGVLEFTSDRKRMSIIIKDRNNQIWLYTKGAESHVLPLCTRTSAQMVISTQRHINEFARLGLRTLAIARKRLSARDFENFNAELLRAKSSLTDRVRLIEQCQQKIETGLELLGATAVEDALQDNVKDTLESLRSAGIKVWVLTGDKIETALNIALSCGHIPYDAEKYFITECTNEPDMLRHLDAFAFEMSKNSHKEFALLIDGKSLANALKNTPELFRDVSIKCRAVLCCRLSPLQKCETVQLMKTLEKPPLTAAIGDGANDVSMIQEAHVGLGIVGREGRQAARCADYAFANFSMVKKVLLVHGHNFSRRLSVLVLYFFYKNLVFMGVQMFFQANSMFSSQSVYDSLFLTLYNVIYTALPILVLSLTEKSYPDAKLMKEPHLYGKIADNKAYSWKYFCLWMLLAVYHSAIVYVFCFLIWDSNPVIFTGRPQTVNLYCFGTIMMHNVVIIANLKLLIETVHKTYVFILSIALSIFGFMITTVFYNFLNLNYEGDMLYVYNNLLSSLTFWLASLLICVTALLPDYLLFAIKIFGFKLGPLFPGRDFYRRDLFRKKRLEPEIMT